MDTTKDSERVAWVNVPTEEDIRAAIPPGGKVPYDLGFIPSMRRLLMAHPILGPSFTNHFRQLMFGPGFLTRQEREMVAAVAAAAQDCRY